jgi:EAL domain-containing protein (putative c-di-GMP-specific phosphodiesterase class I)
MVESMNQVAHALGKRTVAECVENEDTLVLLKEMGVDLAQGNYLGRPADVPLGVSHLEPSADALAQPHQAG